MPPTAFGHYAVIRPLGSGGMADVFLARDPVLDRQVAVKAPHREFLNAESRARFAREARAAAALEHHAIVPIYDYAEQDGLPYMVMRCLTGGSLEGRLARGPLAPAQALPILERIAAALDFAHGQGVIHRDVKSANILFDENGAAYLSDFGIAWMASAGAGTRLTATGMVRGTFDYISPEQAQGVRDLDGRADLYSLGVVLFEMLTGDVPYRADSGLAVAVQHISAPIPDIRARRPDLPPALQNVIARMLAKRPADRYPTGAGNRPRHRPDTGHSDTARLARPGKSSGWRGYGRVRRGVCGRPATGDNGTTSGRAPRHAAAHGRARDGAELRPVAGGRRRGRRRSHPVRPAARWRRRGNTGHPRWGGDQYAH